MKKEFQKRNIIMALRLGIINWFQFFELWRESED